MYFLLHKVMDRGSYSRYPGDDLLFFTLTNKTDVGEVGGSKFFCFIKVFN